MGESPRDILQAGAVTPVQQSERMAALLRAFYVVRAGTDHDFENVPWRGLPTRARRGMHRRRPHVENPLRAEVEQFSLKADRDERFRQLKTIHAKGLVKFSEGDNRWCVAFYRG